MQIMAALDSQLSEVRERASQRILLGTALIVGLAAVTAFAAALLIVAVPA